MSVRNVCIKRIAAALAGAALLFLPEGCQTPPPAETTSSGGSAQDRIAQAANQEFLSQSSYDPWKLVNTDPACPVPAYLVRSGTGYLIGPDGSVVSAINGKYVNDAYYVSTPDKKAPLTLYDGDGGPYQQVLDLQQGTLTTTTPSAKVLTPIGADAVDWPSLWAHTDIVIDGDPQAQQVEHANLFYLMSSLAATPKRSAAPLGLSSVSYNGHIFWDAELWMLPAVIVQHPNYARSIVDYRYNRLTQAARNASAHGYSGAEFPWESAESGKETAPPEFAMERHITADVAFAAWQYYLWTGDKDYLVTEGYPLLLETAQYWVTRVKLGQDGKYHILQVLSPDENAGVVDDDAYTNAVVRYNLIAATDACRELGTPADPRWMKVANALYIASNKISGIPAENGSVVTGQFMAKQADTLLTIYPLGANYDADVQNKMLDYYSAHTISVGPAMTSSIEAVVAARLGRGADSLKYFRDSYQPFMRAPWDAFSEKRTTDNIYFLTGMGGNLQSVLYGFAGLQIVYGSEQASGKLIARDGSVSLYANPHLPPGWTGLAIDGIRFHGKSYNLTVGPGNTASVSG